MSEAPRLAPAPSVSPPRLLVEWSSPWQEFVSSIAPALAKSPKQLAGEAPAGLFPYRGIVAGWLLEVALLAAATVLPGKIAIVSSPSFTPLPRPNEDVIYFSGEELPRTEDLGGAHTGQSGRAGGREGYHRTQTIRVARGESPTEKVVDVPKLNIPKSDLPVANLLAINRTPGPPPTSGLHTSLPALPQPAIVPPSPDVQANKMRTLPASSTTIVAPPPDVQQLATRAVPVSNVSVVAPPPQVARGSSRSLPAVNGGVVAPAPEVKRDQVQTAATGIGPEVVPPSPFMPRRAGGVRVPQMGTEIVPPPVSAPVSTTSRSSALSLPQPGIVAPPPSRISREGVSKGGGGQLAAIQPRIVPPPVDIQGGGGGTGVRGNSQAPTANVVPPALAVTGGGSGMRGGRGDSLIGSGGANAIAAAAPPAGAGGTSNQAGVVISSQPGARMAVPGRGSSGSMAMSPAGTAKSGLGGSGGGNGIGRGNGPGSGLDGPGSGSSKTGAGHGSEVMAKGGTSPFPGAGGAGKNPSGTAPAPGIAVVGGNTITLPSFGSGGGGPNVVDPSRVGGAKSGPGITVVATSRSGGAFNFYGALKGDKVYTIYIDTRFGPAVLQYADPSSAGHAYAQELTAPQPMRADLPTGLTRSRIVIACVLDKSGLLKNVRVLEPASSQASGKLLAALAAWKFRPAHRGAEAVEVNAILGFNIDTR